MPAPAINDVVTAAMLALTLFAIWRRRDWVPVALLVGLGGATWMGRSVGYYELPGVLALIDGAVAIAMVVLAAGGGMLAKLMPIFKLGLGGRTGSGQQYLSWIHRDDVIAVIDWLINSERRGVFNITAPDAVTNARFSELLARTLRRPCLFPQPAAMVLLMFGEMGERLLLNGQNVVPARLLSEGFVFSYPSMQEALAASTSAA
jgi:hypothetical protein